MDLMNDSAEGPTLQERFNKANINIDRTTLKLLPILLKAFNKNKYTEKLIEETTSYYPPYENKDTTDAVYTKNIFTDTRNWMKVPTSRLYAIEYKTSPIVYFKNSTRNVDYFTKIRKIRDYQRMLNYVDKMINEKNGLGSTKPMKSDLSQTVKPLRMTTALRSKSTKKKQCKQTAPKKKVIPANANCKYKFAELMNKLLSSIHQMLSYFSEDTVKNTMECCVDSTETLPMKTLNSIYEPSEMITENNFQSEVIKNTPYKTFLNKHKYVVDLPTTNNYNVKREQTFSTIMNLLKPHFYKRNRYNKKIESYEAASTTSSYDELLQSLSQYFNNDVTEQPLKVIPNVVDYVLRKRIDDIPVSKPSQISSSESHYSNDDDYEHTVSTKNIESNLIELDAPSSQPVTVPTVSEGKDAIQNRKLSYSFKGTSIKQKKYNNIGAMRKMGNLVSSNGDNTNSLPLLYKVTSILKSTTQKTTSTKTNIIRNLTTEALDEKTALINNITKAQNLNITVTITELINLKQNHSDNLKLEENAEEVWEETSPQESALKYIEKAIKSLKNDTENVTDVPNVTYKPKSTRLKESVTSIMSMIPSGRSTYLEMQRNDWKRDEIHEYDNYIFD